MTTDTPCFSLSVIGGVMEATVVPEIPVPVVLISLPSKRGWYQWCGSVTLVVDNLIVNGIGYFFKVINLLY